MPATRPVPDHVDPSTRPSTAGPVPPRPELWLATFVGGVVAALAIDGRPNLGGVVGVMLACAGAIWTRTLLHHPQSRWLRSAPLALGAAGWAVATASMFLFRPDDAPPLGYRELARGWTFTDGFTGTRPVVDLSWAVAGFAVFAVVSLGVARSGRPHGALLRPVVAVTAAAAAAAIVLPDLVQGASAAHLAASPVASLAFPLVGATVVFGTERRAKTPVTPLAGLMVLVGMAVVLAATGDAGRGGALLGAPIGGLERSVMLLGAAGAAWALDSWWRGVQRGVQRGDGRWSAGGARFRGAPERLLPGFGLAIASVAGVAAGRVHGTTAVVAASSVGGGLVAWALVRPILRPGWTRFRLVVTTCTITGLVIRLVTFVHLLDVQAGFGDPAYYHLQANLLARGHGFAEPFTAMREGRFVPTAIHPPFFSAYLSIGSFLGADTYLAHKTLAALAAIVGIPAAAWIGRRIGGDRAGMLAAALVAVAPNLWVIDGLLWPEGVYAAAVGVLIVAAYRWRDAPSARRAAAVGLMVGVAALIRGEALLLAPILLGPLTLWRRTGAPVSLDVRRRLLHLGVMTLVTIAALTPWLVRNTLAFEHPVLLSTNSDEVLFYANCDDTYYGPLLGSWSFPCQERDRAANPGAEPTGDETVRVRYWRAKGVAYVRDHLERVPAVVAFRVGRQWDVFQPALNVRLMGLESRPQWVSRVGQWFYWCLVPIAALGWWIARRRAPTWPLLAQLVTITVTAAVVYGSIRFRSAGDYTLAILAAVGAMHVLDRRRVVERTAEAWHERGRPALDRLLRRPGTLAAAIVGAVVLAPLPGLMGYQGPPMEEGFMLVFPERILHGDWPHRDFLHLYGPGSLWGLALVYRLFGVLIQVERAVGLVQNLAIAVGLYAIVRFRSNVLAIVAAVVSLVIVLPPIGLTALAWNGALGAALLGLAAGLWARTFEASRAARWWTAAGVLGGVALLYRPDMVVAVVAAGFVLVRGVPWPMVRRYLLAGFVTTSLYLVHLVTAGPVNVVRGLFLEPVFDLRGGRTLPAPPNPSEFDGFLQKAGGLRVAAWPFPQLHPPTQVFVWFFLVPASALLVAAAGWWCLRHDRRERGAETPASRALFVAGVFGVGILPQAFQRPDTAHFAWVSCVTFALVPFALRMIADRMLVGARRGRASGWVTALTVAPVAIVLVAVIPFYPVRTYLDLVGQSFGRNVFSYEIRNGERVFYYGSPEAAASAQRVVDRLAAEAKPGERLFVGPVDLRYTPYSDAFLYYLLPLLEPATPFIEMDPGLANSAGSGLAAQVASADWIIQSDVWTGWAEPNDSLIPGPDDPNRVVAEHFCMVEDAGKFRLLRRCH